MKLIKGAILSLVMFVITFAAYAQTYPYSNPTYIPNVVVPQQTLAASGVANAAVTLNGVGVISTQFGGSCPNMVAYPQVSNDGTTYTNLKATYDLSGTAASNVTATGIYVNNVGGYRYFRITNGGSSGVACTLNMVASPVSFSLPR